MNVRILSLIISFIPSLGFCEPEPKSLSKSGAVEAFTLGEGADQICYMVAMPKNKKDGELPLMITHHPKENHMFVVSFALPEAHKNQKDLEISASVKVKDKTQNFILKHEGGNAWATDGAMDRELSELMALKGSEVILQVDTKTKLVYSLKGAGKAFDAINKACPAPAPTNPTPAPGAAQPVASTPNSDTPAATAPVPEASAQSKTAE